MRNVSKKPEELLREIGRRDLRFRAAQGIFMLLLLFGIFAVLFVQWQEFSEFRGASAERQQGIIKLEKHNDEQLGKQTRYIQCLAQFFATKDRANLQLTDLDKCTITRDGSAVNGVDLTPTTTLLPVDNSGSTPVTGQFAAPATTTPPSPAPTPAPEPQTPQPVRVIGLPVCVPFTNVCVRQ